MKFVVDTVTLRHVLFRVFRFFPTSIIVPVLLINVYLHVDPTRRTKGEAWKPSQRKIRNSDIGEGKELATFSTLKE